MGAKERRAKEKMERKNLIVNAAIELIRSAGVGQLTMRKLADAIEYSPCVVYETYPNKQALIIDLFATVCEELLQKMRSISATDEALLYFRKLILKDIEFMMKEPYRVELFLSVSLETPPEEFPAAMKEVIQLIGQGLRKLNYKKLATESQIEEALDVLRTFLAGLMKLSASQKSAAGLKRCKKILENGLSVLLEGWRR